MKKILIILILGMILPSVSALIVTQAQVDATNFTNPAEWTGGYEFGYIGVTESKGFWQIYTTVSFWTLEPYDYDVISGATYELKRGERIYYSDERFAYCWFQNQSNAVRCFEDTTLPIWIQQFYADDFMQRKYLTSLKTDESIFTLPRDLIFYLKGGE